MSATTERKPARLAGLLLLAVGLCHADSGEFPGGIESIASVSMVGSLTGPSSMNRTDRVNVHGTDLGSMFLHGDGRVYFVFGDTFGAQRTAWRSNTMAYATDADASDGITLDGWIEDSSGQAKALLEGRHDPNNGSGEVTKIPTAGWSDGSRQYLWYMSVKRWGRPGQWGANYSGIAYSDDDGRTWSVSQARWRGDGNFVQVAVTQLDGYLLVWGLPAGREGDVKLARVPIGHALETTAYEYYTDVGWSSLEARAATLIRGPVGEVSTLWNDYLGRWLITYLNTSKEQIELRESVQPWGPWSEPKILVKAAQYPSLYGAFMHPRFTENGGQTVYFLMSQYVPYNVFVMKAVFRRAGCTPGPTVANDCATLTDEDRRGDLGIFLATAAEDLGLPDGDPLALEEAKKRFVVEHNQDLSRSP